MNNLYECSHTHWFSTDAANFAVAVTSGDTLAIAVGGPKDKRAPRILEVPYSFDLHRAIITTACEIEEAIETGQTDAPGWARYTPEGIADIFRHLYGGEK